MLDQVEPRSVASDRPAAVCAGSGAVEHRRVEVDPGDGDTRPATSGTASRPLPTASSRIGPPARSAEGEVEIEVAGIVGQVQVVQPGERRGGLAVRRAEIARVDGVSPPSESGGRRGVGPRAR